MLTDAFNSILFKTSLIKSVIKSFPALNLKSYHVPNTLVLRPKKRSSQKDNDRSPESNQNILTCFPG